MRLVFKDSLEMCSVKERYHIIILQIFKQLLKSFNFICQLSHFFFLLPFFFIIIIFLPINNPEEWGMSSEIGHLPGFFCRNLQLTLQMEISSNEYLITAHSKSVYKYPISIGERSFEKTYLENFKYSTINIHCGYHIKLQSVKPKHASTLDACIEFFSISQSLSRNFHSRQLL